MILNRARKLLITFAIMLGFSLGMFVGATLEVPLKHMWPPVIRVTSEKLSEWTIPIFYEEIVVDGYLRPILVPRFRYGNKWDGYRVIMGPRPGSSCYEDFFK